MEIKEKVLLALIADSKITSQIISLNMEDYKIKEKNYGQYSSSLFIPSLQ